MSAFEVLRKRIDKFGVTQPNIQRLGSSGRILVELPGAKDVDRVQNLLQSTAQLEFWETFKNDQLVDFLIEANTLLASKSKDNTNEKTDKDQSSEIDDLLADVATQDSIITTFNPILDRIVGQGFQGGPVLAQFAARDADLIMGFLNQPEVRRLLPSEYRYTRFVWGKPIDNGNVLELYALKSNRDNLAPLSGGVVVDALQTFDQLGNPAVSMQMDSRGARIWEKMTGKAFKEASNIAIVLDNIVYSAPGVSSGAISGGRSEITGNFTLNEGIDLANVLRAGKLPASADIIQSEIVGPSLGKEAIEAGIYSFLIALVIVLLWMIFYYGSSGFFADIALLLNILLIFGILAGLGAVLTLPGIAGIVLTIGISVDANVLIFERVREELNKGKGTRKAIADGFNNALSSILDANITTGLTALILFIVASFTDFLDGMLARMLGEESKLGELLDPIADKIIVATALILLVMDGTIRHYEVIAAIIILTREILISGLREFLAKGKIKLPVSNLAKLKTVLQMVSIALLLSGDTGNKIINFQDYNAQTIGIILLWLSAFLTLFTGYDYMRKGIDHAMSEDNKD